MKKKERVFTFKADGELADVLDMIPNKSEFVRKAIEAALEYRCPLCDGSGTLSPSQHKHMEQFLDLHPLKKCDECDAVHLVCSTGEDETPHEEKT